MTDEKSSSNPDIPHFYWPNKNVVLSSFYWGYVLTQILAGEICRKYGTKNILIGAMVIDSLACISIPTVAATMGSSGVIACRVIQGLLQGFIYPSVYNMLGRWAPASERTLLSTIGCVGCDFGYIITMPLAGLISATVYGWPAVFYFYGSLVCIWTTLWIGFGSNSPAEHKTITEQERNYIHESVGIMNDSQMNVKTPWKDILVSVPFWALIVCCIGQEWGYATFLIEMPNYINTVMKYNIESNGVLCAIPFLSRFLLSFVFSYLADFSIKKKYMTRGSSRKFFNTIGSVVPAATLITICFLPSNAFAVVIILLVATVAFSAATYGGFIVNIIDLAPKFSGILLGVANTAGNISALLAPLLVHFVVRDEGDKSEWNIILVTVAILFLATNLFYVIYCSGEVQAWNDVGNESDIKIMVTKPEKISEAKWSKE